MADSQSGFAALAPRQKMMAIIFLMIAIFIIWDMVGMFRGSKAIEAMLSPSPPAMAADAPVLKSTLPPAPPPAVHQTPTPTPKSIPIPNPPPQSRILTPQQSHPQVEMTLPTSNVFVQQEQIQNKYVSALNELQMLKIQKEIVETSQAIVAAKLATATAEKSISDLFSEASASTKGAATSPSSTLVVPLPPPTPKPIGSGYSVQAVSMGQDQWHAVVKYKNKSYSVGVGDLLPPDNSVIKTIDQNGVVIENAGIEQRIPLSMTDNVGTSETGSTNSGVS